MRRLQIPFPRTVLVAAGTALLFGLPALAQDNPADGCDCACGGEDSAAVPASATVSNSDTSFIGLPYTREAAADDPVPVEEPGEEAHATPVQALDDATERLGRLRQRMECSETEAARELSAAVERRAQIDEVVAALDLGTVELTLRLGERIASLPNGANGEPNEEASLQAAHPFAEWFSRAEERRVGMLEQREALDEAIDRIQSDMVFDRATCGQTLPPLPSAPHTRFSSIRERVEMSAEDRAAALTLLERLELRR